MSASADPWSAAVVVATHDRAALLPRLVAALEDQRDAPPFEVVIVDDASGDSTVAVLERLRRESSLSLRVIRLPRNRGPAAARNAGWRAAVQAGVIAFTDDDCTPTPEWLGRLTGVLGSVDVAQGRTVPHPDQSANLGPFARTLRVEREDGYYQTCNIAYRRDLLERLGGFDETFRYPVGEDTDLAWRAIGSGAATSFVPEAVVWHDVRPSSLRTQLNDTWRWHNVPLTVRRHPGLRARFTHRVFWKPAHPRALLAAAGIATALARPTRGWALTAAATAFGPYVHYRLCDSPLPGTGPRRRILLMPAALLLDLSEVAVCLIGSARWRTLVL